MFAASHTCFDGFALVVASVARGGGGAVAVVARTLAVDRRPLTVRS